MGKLFYMMGKSSSGKDTLYGMLKKELNIDTVVPYTTRPIRAGERDGAEYHFTDKAGLDELTTLGKVVEVRCYNTVHGDWYYFTVDDGSIDLASKDYLIIGTLESYNKTKAYFGAPNVVPIYVDVDDGIRLERALLRERQQSQPKYKEMCRRFIADSEDFSDEKLREAGITKHFANDNLETCFKEIKEFIESYGH